MAQPIPIAKAKTKAKPPALTVPEIPLGSIEVQHNPRVLSSQPEQQALNASVKQHGVLQPIRVRPLDDSGTKFAVIAGHRRLIAAKEAKLPAIPAVVALVDDTDAVVQSLVENLQREDLNPIDEAEAIQALLQETGWTQERLGKRLGRKQSTISNALRLLGLEEPVRQAIEGGQLSASHGRALAALPPAQQEQVAAAAVAEKLPSRQVEERIRSAKEEAKQQKENDEKQANQVRLAREAIEAWLASHERVKAADLTVIVTGYNNGHIERAFTDAGIGATRENAAGERQAPDYDCAEQSTTLTYDPWKSTLVGTCTDDSHYRAYVKERDKDKNARQREVTKRLDRTKTAVMKGVRADDGKGLLNIDGQRLVLYQLLVSHRGYGYGGERYEAFVKRHGGPTKDVKPVDVIECIQFLTEAELGKELALAAVHGLFVNLWGDDASRQNVGEDWAVRQLLVDTFGLDKDLVFGPDGPPIAVLEAKAARGHKLTKAQQDKVAKVQQERDAWRRKFDA